MKTELINGSREIDYIQRQLDKAQRSLKMVPKNAPEKQTWDLMEKILTLESILEMLKQANAIVRCKECKNCTIYHCDDDYDAPSLILCHRSCEPIPVEPCDFCNYGERKEDDDV